MVTDSPLQKIRHHLHQCPEIAGQEKETSRFIIDYLQGTKPDQLLTSLGGYGVAAVYDSKKPGPCIVLRAELDALPIQEHNTLPYKSQTSQVSHACGHDGHMTILLGVAQQLSELASKITGKVVLLFQPAEETAQGAKEVVEDTHFTALEPTMVYALHNLPGYPLGEVIIKDDVYAMASIGVKNTNSW